MKWFLMVMVAVCFIILPNNNVQAQKSKSSTKEQITVGDRLTKYIPFYKPLPCSVFLVDFGASIDDVKKQASKINLVLLDETVDSISVVLHYKDPEAGVDYLFKIVNEKYETFMISVSYKDLHDAIEQLDKLKEVLYFHWDNEDKDDTRANKLCKSDDGNRYISISRKGEDITVFVRAK